MLGELTELEFFSSTALLKRPDDHDKAPDELPSFAEKKAKVNKRGSISVADSRRLSTLLAGKPDDTSRKEKAPVTVVVNSATAMVATISATKCRSILSRIEAEQYAAYLKLLKGLPLFKGLQKRDILPLIKHLRPKRVESDKVIAVEGEQISSLLIFQV